MRQRMRLGSCLHEALGRPERFPRRHMDLQVLLWTSEQRPIKARRRVCSGESAFALRRTLAVPASLSVGVHDFLVEKQHERSYVFASGRITLARSRLKKSRDPDRAALFLRLWIVSGQNGGLLGSNSAALCVGWGYSFRRSKRGATPDPDSATTREPQVHKGALKARQRAVEPRHQVNDATIYERCIFSHILRR